MSCPGKENPCASSSSEQHHVGDETVSPVANAGDALRVPTSVFEETFRRLRACGRGRDECQVLWVGPWADPGTVTEVVHPEHHGHRGGFEIDDAWLTRFWLRLATRGEGVRAQVHTHPGSAFHSDTDDAWPIVHLEGFLSLVIPDFAMGPITLERTYLAEIGRDGEFHDADAFTRLVFV